MVETRRIELLTPCLQGRCSPSWATPPYRLLIYFFWLSRKIYRFRKYNNNCFSSSCPYSIIQYFRYMNQLVGLSGLEPLTSRLSGVRSNQLSYRPILWWRRGESNSWPPACKAGALPAELRPQIWLRYFPQYFVATASHFVNVGYYVFLMLLVTPRLAKNFSPYFFWLRLALLCFVTSASYFVDIGYYAFLILLDVPRLAAWYLS